MKNNEILNTNSINPNDVVMSDDRKEIAIMRTNYLHDYCLLNADTNEQMTDWVNGSKGEVHFSHLNPEIRYIPAKRQVEGNSELNSNKAGNDKPEIAYIWSLPLSDDKNNKA